MEGVGDGRPLTGFRGLPHTPPLVTPHLFEPHLGGKSSKMGNSVSLYQGALQEVLASLLQAQEGGWLECKEGWWLSVKR